MRKRGVGGMEHCIRLCAVTALLDKHRLGER